MEIKKGTRGKIIEYSYFINPHTGLISAKVVYSMQTLIKHPVSGKMINADPIITSKTFPLERLEQLGLVPDEYEKKLCDKALEHMIDAKMLAEAFIRVYEKAVDFQLESESEAMEHKTKFTRDKLEGLGPTFIEGNQ